MVSQENIDEQHESRSYRIIIGVIVFVFLLLAWYAMAKVAVRVQVVRDNMRIRLKPLLFRLCILIVFFFVILMLINRRGKKEQRDQKNIKNKDHSDI